MVAVCKAVCIPSHWAGTLSRNLAGSLPLTMEPEGRGSIASRIGSLINKARQPADGAAAAETLEPVAPPSIAQGGANIPQAGTRVQSAVDLETSEREGPQANVRRADEHTFTSSTAEHSTPPRHASPPSQPRKGWLPSFASGANANAHQAPAAPSGTSPGVAPGAANPTTGPGPSLGTAPGGSPAACHITELLQQLQDRDHQVAALQAQVQRLSNFLDASMGETKAVQVCLQHRNACGVRPAAECQHGLCLRSPSCRNSSLPMPL